MHLLPGAKLMFTHNTASQLGGAIAIENFRGGNHTTLILNNNCFIQYNIGCKNEHQPSRWNVSGTQYIHGIDYTVPVDV